MTGEVGVETATSVRETEAWKLGTHSGSQSHDQKPGQWVLACLGLHGEMGWPPGSRAYPSS